jgi:hypothetical protein
MNTSYRKARKGEITCEQCRYSKIREIGGRLECQGHSQTRHYVTGRKHTCDMAVQRGEA